MQYFPAALQELADQFARLPGIGGKTAQRLAFHVLSLPMEDAQAFADAITYFHSSAGGSGEKFSVPDESAADTIIGRQIENTFRSFVCKLQIFHFGFDHGFRPYSCRKCRNCGQPFSSIDILPSRDIYCPYRN